MAKRTRVGAEIPLETQSKAAKAAAAKATETQATETPETPETPETLSNPAARGRVEAEYDKLRTLASEALGSVLGVWADILYPGEATVAEYTSALETVRLSRVEIDALAALSAQAAALTPSKGITSLVALVALHVREHKVRCPRFTVSFDSDAILAALDSAEEGTDTHETLAGLIAFGVSPGGAPRGRPSGSGAVSANSRISAWTAAREAAKKGCNFAARFRRNAERTGYHDLGAGIGGIGRFIPAKADGGLVGYIFALAAKDTAIAQSVLVRELIRYNAVKAAKVGLKVE